MFLFQNYPRGEGNCETMERQKLSRGNSCPATSRCLFWPTGWRTFRHFQLESPKPLNNLNVISKVAQNLVHVRQRGRGPAPQDVLKMTLRVAFESLSSGQPQTFTLESLFEQLLGGLGLSSWNCRSEVFMDASDHFFLFGGRGLL